ncbi:radical SAM additional 4Fe4S-binding SPASM domain-containing protein [Aneurinibacillus thermoaerophilus]|uniref:Radical SAM additional 4Fe4S-binding SPASM domain-containing protein n=1 Tax=Aneurinibacillus thermoaerophilus TaxID=143495 RepID=A0A1G8E0B3_ANETH|nr:MULTISPECIES: radical SAM protein [Aneurinibacillus]AMA74151.1 hypothetical protein ACH33_15880 [Aneurinibacillus sp. XH2]SDH63334.1 radical SAM additional 4Fe4S-binding SPASM domain-containing protein [Aneurinibacillus thermoaerophilus]
MNFNEHYFSLHDNVQLHLNPVQSSLLRPSSERTEITDNRVSAINKTAAELLMRCDGTKTGLEILEEVCKQYKEAPSTHYVWVRDFFIQLKGMDILQEMEQPSHKKVKVSGNFDYPTPVHATVELLARCNLRCAHCYRESNPEVEDTMSYEDVMRLFSILKDNGIYTLELTGGEITIHPHFLPVLEEALNKFELVGLLTNGTRITDEMIHILLPYKEKVFFSISLDGPNAEVHEDLRRVKGAFRRTCEGIKKLADAGIRVRAAMSVYPKNMWLIEETLLLAKELGAISFSYSKVDPFGRGTNILFEKKKGKEFTEYFEYESSLIQKHKDFIALLTDDQMRLSKARTNCGAGWRSITINPFGDVRPCVLFPQGVMDLGNVFHQPFEDIFRSERALQLFRMTAPVKSETCNPNCKNKNYCNGCVLRAIEANSHYKKPCGWIEENGLASYTKHPVFV